MRELARIGVLAAILMLACTGTREPTSPLSPADSPDYAVYDALLDGLFGEGAVPGAPPRYVIGDSTVFGGGSEQDFAHLRFQQQFGPLLFPLVAEMRADHVARNRVRVPLDPRSFRARGRVEVVSARTLETLRGAAPDLDAYWRSYHARFPGASGRITFSRPGYDAAGTHALLSYGHHCGGRCGDWGYVLLERREGTWVVVRRVITTVS